MNLTTSFNLEQVFGRGQLSLFEFPRPKEEDPLIEMNFSFYLDKEKKTERTVYLEGYNKKWNTKKKKIKIGDKPVDLIDDSSPSNRAYYTASEVRVYDSKTQERVPANSIKKGEEYTVHVDIHPEVEGKSVEIILTDFAVTYFEDYDIY